MFEASILDSGGKGKKATTVVVSTIVHFALLGVLLLIPLIFTEQLEAAKYLMALTAPPPPPPPPAVVQRIGGDVAQANLISSPKPQYPALARAARVQGVVLLNATISKEGTIKDLKVISGHPLLNEAAMEAVRQWRYKPQMLNQQPIEVITTITVNFTFQQ